MGEYLSSTDCDSPCRADTPKERSKVLYRHSIKSAKLLYRNESNHHHQVADKVIGSHVSHMAITVAVSA